MRELPFGITAYSEGISGFGSLRVSLHLQVQRARRTEAPFLPQRQPQEEAPVRVGGQGGW